MGCLLAIGFLAHVSTWGGSSSFKPNPTEEEIKSALPPGWTTGLDEQGVRVYWKTPQSHEDQSPQRQYYLHPRVMKAQKLYNDRRVLRRRAARAARLRAQKLMRQAQIIKHQKPGYHPNPRKHVKPGVPLPPRPQMRY